MNRVIGEENQDHGQMGFNQGERVCPSAPQWLSLENKAGFRTNTAAS